LGAGLRSGRSGTGERGGGGLVGGPGRVGGTLGLAASTNYNRIAAL